MDYKFYYSGPLIFKIKILKEDLKLIKSLCKKDKNKDFRKSLAGIIDHEYLIDRVKIQLILNKYLECHKQAYENFYNQSYPGTISCSRAWVNYMKKGESNPVHVHSDCDFSSVLFLDVPEGLIEENKKYTGTSAGPGSLDFHICSVTSNYIDGVHVLPTAGDFFIFPWSLKHSVSPFKSKGERISVACNFVFKKD